LPVFSWYNIPKRGIIYQITIKSTKMATKYTKQSKNRPNVHIISQHLPLQDPPKFTQLGIMGLKMCHLATLILLLSVSAVHMYLNIGI
jgi:hypothetical protein